MSLIKLYQIIDSSFIGRIVDDKLNILKSIDTDRIYVENVRSFYNLPTSVAKLLCEMAVRNGLFKKKYAVKCHNEECSRVIMTVDSLHDVPDQATCDICEALEREEYVFNIDDTDILPYYQLDKSRIDLREEVHRGE